VIIPKKFGFLPPANPMQAMVSYMIHLIAKSVTVLSRQCTVLKLGLPLCCVMPQETDWTKYIRWRGKPTGLASTYVPLYAELISDARQFITAKQHENISLHSLVQCISINDIAWLVIPGSPRPNPQEAAKRRKLVEDLITWIFEGYLIPLLRVRPTQR
jgi:hypothetical protein